jgi:hypothetical protein
LIGPLGGGRTSSRRVYEQDVWAEEGDGLGDASVDGVRVAVNGIGAPRRGWVQRAHLGEEHVRDSRGPCFLVFLLGEVAPGPSHDGAELEEVDARGRQRLGDGVVVKIFLHGCGGHWKGNLLGSAKLKESWRWRRWHLGRVETPTKETEAW